MHIACSMVAELQCHLQAQQTISDILTISSSLQRQGDNDSFTQNILPIHLHTVLSSSILHCTMPQIPPLPNNVQH